MRSITYAFSWDADAAMTDVTEAAVSENPIELRQQWDSIGSSLEGTIRLGNLAALTGDPGALE